MKINFKKVATVLGSALMLGSTAAFAAAASFTPSSFTDGGVALVVGQNAASSDLKAAIDLTANLAPATSTVATTTATVEGGDSYKIEKTSTKFHLGDFIGNITTSNIDEDDMPNLLADGKYLDDNNDEFDYKQKINLNNDSIRLQMFNDNDYAKDAPTIGFRLTNNEHILNYTLDFTDKPYFNELETTDMPIMGKEYYVLDVTSDNTTITLLDSASDTTLAEGDTTTLTVGDKTYEVSVDFVSSTPSAKLVINGETTNSLAAGQTQKLSDGAYIGIKEVLYTAKDTGVSKVEFSIGSGKLKIQNNAKVQMNDEDVKNVYGYVVASSNQLDDVVLQWKANDETFITADNELTLPGFNNVKLSFGGVNFPTEETFSVEAGGNDYVELNDFPLKGGSVNVAIAGKAAGNSNYTFIGSDTDELVVTSAGSTLTFDGSSDTNDDYFIVSWSDADSAESYLVRATSFNDPTTGDDTVDFEYNDGSGWTTKYDNSEQGDEINFGNADLTVTTLNSSTGNEAVTLTAGTNVEFDVLYTNTGLKAQMPYVNTTQVVVTTADATTTCALGAADSEWPSLLSARGEIGYSNILVKNATAAANITCTYYGSSYQLIFTEEDKDDDKGEGASFNVTIGNNGASNYYSSVTGVNNATSTREKDDTDVYQSWMYSALATKFVEDDSGDQDMVTITYHGSEVIADVFLLAPEATVTAGTTPVTTTGVMTVYDNEVSSASGKNLIVIGGSCVNTVAAELLGGALCGDAFTAATGIQSGEALIESFAREGKTALLVAGFNAEDTTKAITYLSNNNVNVAVGSKMKVTSATTATAITA